MTDILVRDLPDEALSRLKERAARNRRSLRQELIVILESAADIQSAADAAREIREKLERRGREFGDSVQEIREDRER